MDWVILAGTVGHEVPWTRGTPRPLLPMPDRTLLDTLLDTYHRSASGSCTICANGHTGQFTQHMQQGNHPARDRVGFVVDSVPRGAAGCLKACENRMTGGPIAVAGGAVWLEDDPEWMLEQHRAQGNTLTVFCASDHAGARPHCETLRRPAGIYFCEPDVLEFIQRDGYQDLKEQLIPRLQQAGLRVGAVTLEGATCEVSDWAMYLRVLSRVLLAGRLETTNRSSLAEGIWAGQGTQLATRARVVGPVLLGDRCRLEDDSVVVGPAILGHECHVGRGAWVVRALLPDCMTCEPGRSIIDQFVPGPRQSADSGPTGNRKEQPAMAGTGMEP